MPEDNVDRTLNTVWCVFAILGMEDVLIQIFTNKKSAQEYAESYKRKTGNDYWVDEWIVYP